MAHTNDENEQRDFSNRDVIRILMQEIADVRLELKEDIARLDTKIDTANGKIDNLSSNVATLRLEVHQNQISFMKHIDSHDQRIHRLEAKVA